MLARFVDHELLAPTGLWSIARSDTVHWSREDCDWGGGGQYVPSTHDLLYRNQLGSDLSVCIGRYVGQSGRLAEMLFTLNETAKGFDLMKRMVTWVEKFPYFPQTIYGDNLMLQPHERNWFLQVSAGAGAQAVVNGIFGANPSICSPACYLLNLRYPC